MTIMDYLNSAAAKVSGAAAAVMGVLLFATSMAHADAVADAFTSLGTGATTTIGLGITLIIAVLTLGFGVNLLVKYAKKARSAA